jgi:hypothetical protein
MRWRRTGPLAVAGAAALLVAGCASPPAVGSAVRVPERGCVTAPEATRIWTAINSRLLAIELAPDHAGASSVTTGDALTLITSYLQRQLVSQAFTEHEVDRLDSLRVVDAGCNGTHLVLNVTMTVVQDDYLNADGSVNHSDPSVGTPVNLLQEYVKLGGVWKESDLTDLSQAAPSPTPTLLGFRSPACYTWLRSI